MALHTGEADLRDGDYYGSAVNRCARLRNLAHGGQVLLSGTTAALARDSLSAEVRLLELGAHRLQDLAQVEVVYQLLHPELPPDFPPAVLGALPNNLPTQLTSFIGREREVAEVAERLQDPAVRLLTLVGSGGTGKTRLAVEAAGSVAADFTGGVFLVDLAPLTDPNLVVSTVATVLASTRWPGRRCSRRCSTASVTSTCSWSRTTSSTCSLARPSSPRCSRPARG
jgi:hypothetical protein